MKREELGVGSRFLHDQVTEGTILEIAAPAGKFVFDDSRHTAITLVAGGVGITPMMSLARSLTERSWPGDIYFVFVVRTPKDIIFREELERISLRFRNFHLHITLSDPVTDPNWQGATGRITGQLLSQIVTLITGHPVHVYGPGPMMDATCEILRTIGVPDHLICTKAFLSPTGISRPSGTIEVTTNNDDVIIESVIEFSKSRVVTTSTSGISVLEAAEAAGVEIPWECRSGFCGQCKVRLRRGSVRMEVEDALSEKEKEAGFILACKAHPNSQLEIEA